MSQANKRSRRTNFELQLSVHIELLVIKFLFQLRVYATSRPMHEANTNANANTIPPITAARPIPSSHKTSWTLQHPQHLRSELSELH